MRRYGKVLSVMKTRALSASAVPHLHGGHARGQHKALVVAVHHDHHTNLEQVSVISHGAHSAKKSRNRSVSMRRTTSRA